MIFIILISSSLVFFIFYFLSFYDHRTLAWFTFSVCQSIFKDFFMDVVPHVTMYELSRVNVSLDIYSWETSKGSFFLEIHRFNCWKTVTNRSNTPSASITTKLKVFRFVLVYLWESFSSKIGVFLAGFH